MKKLSFVFILVLVCLIQVSWASFLSIHGFVFPLVLLVLLLSSFFWKIAEVLVFAFGVGIFLNLLVGGLVGSQSLSLILALTTAQIVRNLFLQQKLFGFSLAVIAAIVVYQGILRL